MKKRKREIDVLEGAKNTRLSFTASIQKFRHKDAPEDTAAVKLEPEEEEMVKEDMKEEAGEQEYKENIPSTPKKEKSKKTMRSPKKRAGVPPPKNWEEMFDRVREMRKLTVAPVDTMGCERLALTTVSARVRTNE